MTTPSVDRPVSVEPMTDAQIDALRVPRSDGLHMVFAGLIATIDGLKARALPLPRRYTGGPLEDGLYLWRAPHWDRTNAWVAASKQVEIGDALAWNDHWPFVWLIGPITIPDIPSEEASS